MTRLLVDNDDHINRQFQGMFAIGGFDTRGTWSGQEALRLLESGEFDVLLLSA
jgi:DNA-binding response OmpR family regulator